MNRPHLSVIIPLFNEEDTLPELLGALRAVLDPQEFEYEIMFVDDGSRDRTYALAVKFAEADKRLKIVRLGRNFGQQVAITAGLDFCTGENAVVMDADLQDPPDLIPEMLAKRNEGFDIVYAKRTQRHGETKFKRFSAKAFYWLMTRLAGLRIPENAGDFRLLSRKAVEELRKMREHHRYLRGMTTWIGLPQTAVYYERPPRKQGQTKWSLAKMVTFALDAICSFSYVPLRLATLLGLVTSFVCVAYLAYVLVLRFTGQFLIQGWPSTIVAVLLLGSVQLVCLGIIGEFLGRVYEEVKGRPIYTIMETQNLESAENGRSMEATSPR